MSIVEPRSGVRRAPTRSLTLLPSRTSLRWWDRLGATPHLVLCALVAALLRVPFLRMALTPDEAGFSLVARQWHAGPSLYGGLWVDRPPLLLELFDLASRWGTPVGLRLLGCLAVFAATLCVGLAARRAAGPRAGFWAAAVAGVGLSSPALGALPVNGELLAAPFVAGTILCWVEATRRPRSSRLFLLTTAGALAAAAVLVKQNMVDGLLFLGVATALEAVHRRRHAGLVLGATLAAWATGAVAAVVTVLGLAVARGTSVPGIWYAMYPFRLAAANTIQGASGQAHLVALLHLGGLELLTLGPVVLLVLALLLVRLRRTRGLDVRIVGPAVLVLAAYDVFSIAAGGSYWTHYLVELVVPTALAAGIVAARRPRSGVLLAALVTAVSLVLGAVAVQHLPQDHAASIGDAVGDVSRPGDTIVSALGDADIVQASGLRSDYPYLWSLPARTLDPRFTTLATLLDGPDAPTWLVVRGPGTLQALSTSMPGAALRHHYREVAHLCGRIVYVNDAVDRRTPTDPSVCAAGSS